MEQKTTRISHWITGSFGVVLVFPRYRWILGVFGGRKGAGNGRFPALVKITIFLSR